MQKLNLHVNASLGSTLKTHYVKVNDRNVFFASYLSQSPSQKSSNEGKTENTQFLIYFP
jgi:hypothetical protein